MPETEDGTLYGYTDDLAEKDQFDTRDVIETLQIIAKDILFQAENEFDIQDNIFDDLHDIVNLIDHIKDCTDYEAGEEVIRGDRWVEYVKEMLEDTTDGLREIDIDWEKTAEHISADYIQFSWKGHDWYVRG